MKNHTKTFYSVILIFLVILTGKAFHAHSVNTEINFDIFQQEDGLPNNRVHSICQDKRGWMWFGTSQGLSRFDGYSFVNFQPDANDSTSISGSLVRVIKEDSNGNLYIGTETGGLNLFNRDKECFSQPYKNHPAFKHREVSVNEIVEDSNGKLWIGTDFNIVVIDSSGNLTPLEPDMIDSELSFSGNFVRDLEFDNLGKLWIGTDNGVFVYDTLSNKMESFSLPYPEGKNNEIWEIYLDEDDVIWIGTYTAGAFLVDPKSKLYTHVELDASIERSETVRSISKGILGEYWIGTRGGLFVYSKTKGVTGYYNQNKNEVKSLSNNSILSIYHDSKGETWIGTRGGVNLLAKSKQAFRNFKALPGDNSYLNSSTIYCFWINDDGKIWIGTEDGGINIYDPVTQSYEYIMADEQDGNSISQNCIKTIQKDTQDRLWIGTYLGGIDVIDLKTNKITHYQHQPDQPESLIDNRVWDIYVDKAGEIWIVTTKGLDRFLPETNTFKHYTKPIGNDIIYWIESDSKGNLWMGSKDEVIVYNPKRNIINRFFEHTRSMFENSKNEIWIATDTKGIAKYSATSGPLKYYDESDGLANNQALCFLEDDDFNLWISTYNGLSKFNTSTETFQNFSSKDG